GAWQTWSGFELSYLLDYTNNRATDPGAEPGSGLPPTRGDVYRTEAWTHLLTGEWSRPSGGGTLKFYSSATDADWLRRTTSANADSLNDSRLTGVRWREHQRLWDAAEIIAGVDLDWTKCETSSVSVLVTAPPLVFG